MKGLLHITRVIVPQDKAEAAHLHLRKIGRQGSEAVALWVGVVRENSFEVRETIIPKQTPQRTPTGILFTVSPQELHRINVWLHENEMQIIAQLHSHPQEAYHSELDDELPLATTVGCLSLVIPNFARDPFSLRRCAIYRLIPDQGWTQLSPAETARLITVRAEKPEQISDDQPSSHSKTPPQKQHKTLWDWLHFFKKRP